MRKVTENDVVGVDACRRGWVVVARSKDNASDADATVCATFSEALAISERSGAVAVDIPIGLPNRGGRKADQEARSLLPKARKSSVFSIPSRGAIFMDEYRDAAIVALLTSDPARSISKQAFNIFDKIREVDELLKPTMQARVFECHPEVSFLRMSRGVAAKDSKAKPAGQADRRQRLLKEGFERPFLDRKDLACGVDDFLDACAASWTAARIAKDDAERLPNADPPPRDSRGLRMEIWY